MKHRAAALTVAALSGGGLLAAAVPALAAVSASSPPAHVTLRLLPDGPVIARGAQAYVAVRVSCRRPGVLYASAQLTQRAGRDVAFGFGTAQVACTGAAQRVVVPVPASAGGRPFHAGAAASVATLAGELPGRGFLQLQVDGALQLHAR